MGCVSARGLDACYRDASSAASPSPFNFSRKPSSASQPGLPSLAAAAYNAVPPKPTLGEGIGQARFIHEQTGKVQEFYDLGSKLGQGAYGSVVKCTHKELRGDGGERMVRAIKAVEKAKIGRDRLSREIGFLKLLDHPGIIKLYETFEDDRNVYLVTELCAGGELFDRIISLGHFTEGNAATVIKQIGRAVFYMHEVNVVHRDIKPENFLFSHTGRIDGNTLKIIDFGLSAMCRPGETLKTKVGTPYYVAPQVLRGSYDRSCDCWSVGVIMYLLLAGYPPFGGAGDAEILAKVKVGKFSFPKKDWSLVSKEAQNLIKSLLTIDPAARLTAEQALQHDWVVQAVPNDPRLSLRPDFVDNLRQFRSQGQLKKAALQVIARLAEDSKIQALRNAFNLMDVNGDGLLSFAELRAGLEKAGVSEIPADFQDIVLGIDSDGSGVIDYTEFLAASLERKSYCAEETLRAAFRAFDLDGDGCITRAELSQVLGADGLSEKHSLERAEALVREIDTNGDGMIDLQEFMAMMRRTASEEVSRPLQDASRSRKK